MDWQPILQGELVVLQPLQASDFERLFAVACDPEIWAMHPEPNRYKKDIFETFFTKALASKGALLILDRHTQDVVGSSRYYDFDAAENKVNIGYTFYARKFWGGRYNREIKTLMLHYAFQYVDKVHFQVGQNNLRSRRAMEKIGAILIAQGVQEGRPYVKYEVRR